MDIRPRKGNMPYVTAIGLLRGQVRAKALDSYGTPTHMLRPYIQRPPPSQKKAYPQKDQKNKQKHGGSNSRGGKRSARGAK